MSTRHDGFSPLGLRSVYDIVHDFLDGEPSAFGVSTLAIFAFAAKALPAEQHLSLLHIQDLDIDRDLEPASRRGRGGAESDRNVLLILENRAAHDGLGPILRRLAHPKPTAQLSAHLLEELLLEGRR